MPQDPTYTYCELSPFGEASLREATFIDPVPSSPAFKAYPRFYSQDSLTVILTPFPGDNPNKPVNPLITGVFGAVAGAASVFGNTPLDVIKTRMQVGDRES